MLDITEDVIRFRHTQKHIGINPAGVYVFDTPEEADSRLVDDMEEVLQTSMPKEGLILSTGSSYESVYRIMAERHDRLAGILKELILINQDELSGIPENDPLSFRRYMREKLFAEFPELKEENWIIPHPGAHPVASLEKFKEQLKTVQSIKLAMLGIGPDEDPKKGLEPSPHIAFIRPNTPLDVLAEIVDLDEITRHANSNGDPENYPAKAITHGPANVLRAENLFLLAKGLHKQQNMKKVLLGKFDPGASATLVQIAPRVTHYLDREAAELTLSTMGKGGK